MSRIAKKLLYAIMAAALLIAFIPSMSYSSFAYDADGRVPAFPGAVGGGKYATGGRGGTVVHVTNLNDSGPGSFREAVSKPNRIVIFDVSGTIELKGNILVSDNITIAGQTAPGGSGITLKNYKLGMSGNNIICRYISSRPGPFMATSSGNDAWGGAKGSDSIIDHCSMSWASDEQWGLYSYNERYTVQYSVIGPADSWGGHSKGIHGFGLMMGNGYFTFDHNLIVHNVSRNFRGKIPGTKTADFTNNVIYNWAYETAYGTIGHLNYVNNTLKMGNGTVGGYRYVNVDSTTKPENFKIYLSGNRMLNKDGSVYNQITSNNWAGVTYKSGIGKNEANTRVNSPFETILNGLNVSTALTAESASESYENVLKYAGNGISPELRTAVDRQAAAETRTGTGNLSGTASYSDADSADREKLSKYNIECSTVYEYPEPVLKRTVVDTDNDGMPDAWELARGLNPYDPTDTNGDYCGMGYTNIEYYINDLTVNSFPEGTVALSPTLGELNGATLQDGCTYMIRNIDSGLYLSVDGAAANGSNVIQKKASAAVPANTWRLVSAGNGCYYIVSCLGNGASYALDVTAKSPNNGTNMEVYSFSGNNAQQFMITPDRNDGYVIRTKVSNGASCIEIAGASHIDGANVQEWEAVGELSQIWTFEKIKAEGSLIDTGKSYLMKNCGSGKYIDNTLNDCSQPSRWRFEYAGGGYYRMYIDGSEPRMYISVYFTDGGSSGSVYLDTDSKTNLQLFKPVINTDGSYSLLIKSVRDNMCLTAASEYSDAGVSIYTFSIGTGIYQKWMFEVAD